MDDHIANILEQFGNKFLCILYAHSLYGTSCTCTFLYADHMEQVMFLYILITVASLIRKNYLCSLIGGSPHDLLHSIDNIAFKLPDEFNRILKVSLQEYALQTISKSKLCTCMCAYVYLVYWVWT